MNSYLHLLTNCCEQSGQDPQGLDGGVLKFDIDGREAVVQPARLPGDTEAIEVSVAVGLLPCEDAMDELDALMLLHQINAQAWPRHGWLACVDEDGCVAIRKLTPLLDLTATDLQPLVADGLDRAAALQAMLGGDEQTAPIITG
jgi:hypothetical protein